MKMASKTTPMQGNTDQIYLRFIWKVVVWFEFVGRMFLNTMFNFMKCYSTANTLKKFEVAQVTLNPLTLLLRLTHPKVNLLWPGAPFTNMD